MILDHFNAESKVVIPEVRMGLRFKFKTSGSIGFVVALIPDDPRTIAPYGDIQIHHPCSGHIKARIYAQFPKTYREYATLDLIRKALFREVGIPADETYEFQCEICDGGGLVFDERRNREGITDGI
jgi:hypothetical protein